MGVLQASLAATEAPTSTNRWLGGQSTVGLKVKKTCGGAVSRTATGNAQVAWLPEASVAVIPTSVSPNG